MERREKEKEEDMTEPTTNLEGSYQGEDGEKGEN